MTIRETFEQFQNTWLAPYAVREADSGGRAFAEPEHSYRTCFQRDRDRIVHCSAFRRLDFKTQVFVPHTQDHFRTRMTHTIEVAQIGRTLARALRLNEDLVEAVALAHDLGHPPFGHAGEAVLNELMADHGHFEHNRQSLRVVDYLEHPYPQFRGLNLSRVVRECLAKHKTRYDAPLGSEFDTTLQAPLEGQLADAADEIAYTSADLEDALAAGWITTEQLSSLSLWQDAARQAQAECPDASPMHQRIRAVKAVLAAMAGDLIKNSGIGKRESGSGNRDSGYGTREQRTRLNSVDDVRRAGGKLVEFSPAVRRAVDQMQDFLLKHVYLHEQNARQEQASRQVIQGLFRAYTADPMRLPSRYQSRVPADGLHRVTCDYIAGMTDRFCRQEYDRLGTSAATSH